MAPRRSARNARTRRSQGDEPEKPLSEVGSDEEQGYMSAVSTEEEKSKPTTNAPLIYTTPNNQIGPREAQLVMMTNNNQNGTEDKPQAQQFVMMQSMTPQPVSGPFVLRSLQDELPVTPVKRVATPVRHYYSTKTKLYGDRPLEVITSIRDFEVVVLIFGVQSVETNCS